MCLQSGSAIASSVPVVCIPKRQFRASSASTRWNTSRRSWLLFVLSVAVLVPSVTAGEWLGNCSANETNVLKKQVDKCGPELAKKTNPYLPTILDFKMIECEPGCKCLPNGVSVEFASFEDSSNCGHTTVVEILQGAMYVSRASTCRQSCIQCVSSNCRFRCTTVSSASCLLQMAENGNNSTVPVTTTTVSTTKSVVNPSPTAVNKPSALSAGEIVGIVTGILGALATIPTSYVIIRNRRDKLSNNGDFATNRG
jgi:hypothetical protein